MTYAEAIQFLYDLRMFGAKLGLENTFKLAELSGNPQRRLRFIHVAGTNGKGSTCAMLESIYRSAGLRVGLFTSPHLVSFRERIQVNRGLISEAEVSRLTEGMKPLVARFSGDAIPTFFEVVTVMACQYFAEQNCDLVIWETGLGGRLDATNIVSPIASVITNIGLDHQKWLGDTIEQIAFEKSGIIKPGVPVITATQQPEALEVISRTAREKNAPLRVVTAREVAEVPELSLAGSHQRLNAAVAIATVRSLEKLIPVTGSSLEQGLRTVSWAGRLQIVNRGEQRLLLDGAHNTEGVATLVETLRNDFATERLTLILGILSDKEWRPMCRALAPLGNRILLTPVASERTVMPEELLEVCRAANPGAELASCRSATEALEKSSSDSFVVVTGSLYLIGEVLELLGLSPTRTSERGLNEYTPAPRK